ncbi:MAG: SGNH/GDSL hydrolase family protein [Eubacterium sp.]|nr:SGNH/GDSL hydrolase family protein [Eubacterium sp.]
MKLSKGKKIIIVICVLAVLACGIGIPIADSQGKFSKGNADEYSLENTQALESSPLKDKTIIFLGSSVTYGSASKGESFADFMEKRDGIISVKEAVSGTTLVDTGDKSYVSRMKTIDKSIKADAFICQLSTNDATKKKPLGKIADGFDIDSFNTQTVAGAIEYIIAYARQTWDCPVIFYTGTKYDSAQYGKMVDLLLEIQQKWDIGVIDLWNNEEMNSVSKADYKLYMANGIHPTRAGYRDWWLPVMEEYLYNYL